MKKQLNNDQKIRNAHKEVQSLGPLATTVLLVEISEAIENRIKLLKPDTVEYNNFFYSKSQAVKVLELFLKNLEN